MKLEFEEIGSYCQRAKIHGGWLVKTYEDVIHSTDNGMQSGWDFRVSICFVPDPNHKWKDSK